MSIINLYNKNYPDLYNKNYYWGFITAALLVLSTYWTILLIYISEQHLHGFSYITIWNRKLTWNRFRLKQATPNTIKQNAIISNIDTKRLDNLQKQKYIIKHIFCILWAYQLHSLSVNFDGTYYAFAHQNLILQRNILSDIDIYCMLDTITVNELCRNYTAIYWMIIFQL